MAYDGINWQTIELPLAAGLNQKTDDRARPGPYLDICTDVQFDEVGGLQTRYPFSAAAGAIFGGGTIANARRIVSYGTEHVLFTKDAIYSWNAQLAKWVLRGTHLAVDQVETPRFVTTGDQFYADRAELNGTIVYTWHEGSQIFVAAVDKTTGDVLMAPSGVTGFQSRVLALTTKILFFVHDFTTFNLTVRALDPADPATGFAAAATSIVAGSAASSFDVTRVLGADQAVGACQMTGGATTYTAFTVTAGLTVATSLKARTANGVIAVASRPSAGAQTHVFRTINATTSVLGDVLTTSTLADVTINQAIGTFTGTPLTYVTACYRSVQTAGRFVCVVFWTAQASALNDATLGDHKINTVDDAGTIGTQATFIAGLPLASRAFDVNGSIFVHLSYEMNTNLTGSLGATVNNTYFLYREDRTLHGKSVGDRSGGVGITSGVPAGVLPGVAFNGTSYAWAGSVRRVGAAAPTAAASGLKKNPSVFAARSVIDIVITFDSNKARRCAALGRTLYVTGSQILQFDGVQLVECGFDTFADNFVTSDAGAGTGSMGAGTYAYKPTYRYVNSVGEVERSTTAAIGPVVVAAGTSSTTSTSIGALLVTRKSGVAVEIWRSAVSPTAESPFYLASSSDPTQTSNPNRYLVSAAGATPTFTDALADATLIGRETNPENGAVLESLAPPGASIIHATDTRLFLAGVAGDPDRVWYSRERGDGEIASFHDTLTADVPRAGGDITSLAFLNETLIVFRATAIYALPGIGKDNLGQGQTFGPARTISLDVGAISHETVAFTPMGLVFKSRKGWYLLEGSGSARYIGDKISDFDGETVLAVNVVETQHQVRVLTDIRLLVWDYLVNQWGEWTIDDGVHACMFGGAYVYLAATGTRTQLATYTALTYGIDIETSWIKLADLQGAGRTRKLQLLGEYRSAHSLRLRVAYNYLQTYVDDKVWEPSPTTIGGPLQVKHGPKRPQCQAIKLRITAVAKTDPDLGDARAELRPLTDGPTVATSGANWAPRFKARAAGELGNLVTLSIGFDAGTTPLIDVRAHLQYDPSTGLWTPMLNNIGVRVVLDSPSTLQADDLTSAVGTMTSLAATAAVDPVSGKTVALSMIGQLVSGAFHGGFFTAPDGEALKLTGLGLEVGVEPGLFRRLPSAQQQ